MGDFFHGWRRKTGCVTLVMACLFATGWVRSYITNDKLVIRHTTSRNEPFTHLMTSNRGLLKSKIYTESPNVEPLFPGPTIRWNVGDRWDVLQGELMAAEEIDWRRQWRGFDLGTGGTIDVFANSQIHRLRFATRAIPYWSIALPLTVISAWLLLSKPRKPNPKSLEPAEAEGT